MFVSHSLLHVAAEVWDICRLHCQIEDGCDKDALYLVQYFILLKHVDSFGRD